MELSHEIITYIDKYKQDYEQRYDITIYYWFVRKSTLRGLGRSTSDLDVVFLFKNNSSQKRNIIFERADRRNEFQCWSIDVLLEIIEENRRRVQESKEFDVYNKDNIYDHYILDYYNGFYCSIGNCLNKDYYDFRQQCEDVFMKLYEPMVASKICYQDFILVIKKVKAGYMISLNQYLNGIWAGLASIHFLKGGLPGDININHMAELYLNSEEVELVKKLVQYFRKTIQKQSNYCNLKEINEILKSIGRLVDDTYECYTVEPVDIDKETDKIKKFIDKRGN